MNDDPTPNQELAALRDEHRALDERISAMVEAGESDQIELARLKKRKLRLKDQIQLILDRSVPDIIA
ncbi:MAG TPA: DUF465 domain-containing protein [Sphingomicrobium sp.]|nr:DUF465 domain-containing protein [Sphingomicrobium sp.]